jgi:hypothetical protein
MREQRRDFYLTLDLRSLALFRMALALLLLHDAASRWPDLEAFYTSSGLLPADASWPRFGAPFHFSWLDSFESLDAMRGVFVAGMLCALALLVGFQTRVAQILSFLFLVGVRNRNPLLTHGGDAALTVICLWGLLMPLGARLSIDAWRAARRRSGPPPNRTAPSLVGLAYAFQIGFIYLTTAVAKTGPAWHDGTAVYYALQLDQFASPLGVAVRAAPLWLLKTLSYGTFALEWAALPLILSPVAQPWLRGLTLLALVGFHLGTAVTMTLGSFPFVMCASFLPLVRPSDWDDLQRLFDRRRGGATPGGATPAAAAPRRIANRIADVVAVFLIVCIIGDAFNQSFALRLQRRPLALPLALRAPLLAFDLGQGWRMFAPEPLRRDGWWIVAGITETGAQLDPLTGTAPRSDKPPNLGSRQSVWWRMYLFNISRPEMRPFQIYFARWLAGRTRSLPPERRLQKLDFWWMQEDTPPPGSPPPPVQRFRLWSWDGAHDIVLRGDV